MAGKDYYDEDEIIDSLVNEKTPQKEEKSHQNQWQHAAGYRNMQVRQAGCGCFNMRKFVTNFLIYCVVLMVTDGFFPGFYLAGIFAAIQASFILTVLNTFVKPLIVAFTFPITVASLGLFYFLINAVIIMMTAGLMRDAFVINNFAIAILAATFISILQYAIKKYLLKVDQL